MKIIFLCVVSGGPEGLVVGDGAPYRPKFPKARAKNVRCVIIIQANEQLFQVTDNLTKWELGGA